MEAIQIKPAFRVFPEGDVIALWEDKASSPKFISSYQKVGQHSYACRSLITELRPATTEETKPLANELQSIGYHWESTQ